MNFNRPGVADRDKISNIAGATFGDPYSASTYSGVPYYVFAELEKRNMKVSRCDLKKLSPLDLTNGLIDFKRSLKSLRPKVNPYWRYLPEIQTLISKRIPRPPFDTDAVLQIGVAGSPLTSAPLFAHVEFSIQEAATDPVFSKNYGFSHSPEAYLKRAIAGEKYFLEKCARVWTNSEWTASTFEHHGIPQSKFWIHPPPCSIDNPGRIERNWEKPKILFVGKDWDRKGGPELVEAYKRLKPSFPELALSIIGCKPRVDLPGVLVHGFLDKSDATQYDKIKKEYETATLFCLPSVWESVGIVYMEASIYGLPSIMCNGQGREGIFPNRCFKHVSSSSVDELESAIESVIKNPDKAREYGSEARRFVLENYTIASFADKFIAMMTETISLR